MADDFDPYAVARDRVRESVKWLYTVATGVAAVLFAALSWSTLLTILAGDLRAAALAVVLVICVGASIWATLNVLASRPYGLGNITEYLKTTIDRDHPELFSDKLQSMADLSEKRKEDPKTFQRVLSFSSYLSLQRRAVRAQWIVAISAIVGGVMLGLLLNVIAEQPKAEKDAERMEIVLSPDSIEALARALTTNQTGRP